MKRFTQDKVTTNLHSGDTADSLVCEVVLLTEQVIEHHVDGVCPAEAQLIRLLDAARSHVYILAQVGDDRLPYLGRSVRPC